MDQSVMGLIVIVVLAIVGFVIFWLGFDTVHEPDHGWVSIFGLKVYPVKPGLVWVPPLIGKLQVASYAVFKPKIDIQETQCSGDLPVNFTTWVVVHVQLRHKVDAMGLTVADFTSLRMFLNKYPSTDYALAILSEMVEDGVETFIKSKTADELKDVSSNRALKKQLEGDLDEWGKSSGWDIIKVVVGQLTSPFLVAQNQKIREAQTRRDAAALRGAGFVSEIKAIIMDPDLPEGFKKGMVGAVNANRALEGQNANIFTGGTNILHALANFIGGTAASRARKRKDQKGDD